MADTALRRILQCAVRYLPPRRRGLQAVTIVNRCFPPDGTRRRTRLINGVSIEVDLRDAVQSSIFYRGLHEPAVTAVLNDELRDGDVFCDFGANIGYFTFLASPLVGRHGTVHAFEPSPTLALRLAHDIGRNRHRLNDNIVIHEVAVGDTTATAFLSRPGGTFSEGEQHIVLSSPPSAPGEPVRIVAVDELLPTLCFDVAKLDIEGCELRALRGMDEALRRSPARLLLVERVAGHLARWGDDPGALDEFLAARGYRAEHLSGREEAPMVAYRRAVPAR